MQGWRRTLGIGLAASLGLASPRTHGAAPLPPRLDTYLTSEVALSSDARARLLAGAPVTKLLESDLSKEVAIFGGVWIDAPIERYLAATKDIERFESGGGFRFTTKLSSPPRLDDFAQLSLPADDVQDLRSCKITRCELKLSEDGIARVRRGIDWTRPDARDQVDRMARQVALEYVNSYLEGGNQRLATYRDEDRPTFVAAEFASMIERLPPLSDQMPALRRYLLDFPTATLPGSDSFLYWQEARFGLKPTIRINHVVISQSAGDAVVASKMVYASHYFWTALELRVLLRDPARGNGFWFVTESRSRSDGLSGFTGRIIRGKVRGESEKGTTALLQLTKSRMEAR
jgi:hypothetical protein